MEKLRAIDFRFFIGCSCYIVDEFYKSRIPSIIEGVDGLLNKVIIHQVNYDPNVIKLVLRRFESLSREEIQELNKLWPNENIKRSLSESINLDAYIINYLTLLHIDVFNWIDKGLAIDAAYN